MAKRLDVYKCDLCGNIVEVYHGGAGQLACCGQPMKLLVETTTDGAVEKHVPVVNKVDGGFEIAVGSVEHPMTADHYIEWIEIVVGDKVYTKYLLPGRPAKATFMVDGELSKARAYCNLHGHWKNK